MGRIPSALALLEAPVHAVVMDTDGTVQTGLSTGLFIRLLPPWMCFHRPPVRARFVLCWANWFATRQAGTRAVYIRRPPCFCSCRARGRCLDCRVRFSPGDPLPSDKTQAAPDARA